MSHVERILILTLLLGVALGAYFLYRSPQIQELIQPPNSVPAKVDLPPAPPVKRPEPTPRSQPATPSRSGGQTSPAETESQVPNREVARVLLQILAARGLAGSINLSVTDERIEVLGEVESQQERATVLEVLEKGRESRQIVADQLVVRNPQ